MNISTQLFQDNSVNRAQGGGLATTGTANSNEPAQFETAPSISGCSGACSACGGCASFQKEQGAGTPEPQLIRFQDMLRFSAGR